MKEQSTGKTQSRVAWVLLIMVAMILFVCNLPSIIRRVDNYSHQNLWNQHGTANYEITLQSIGLCPAPLAGTTTVRNAKISTDTGLPMKVDDLFSRALDCTLLCSVDYDNYYGYPAHIGGGFVESCDIRVTDFKILPISTP